MQLFDETFMNVLFITTPAPFGKMYATQTVFIFSNKKSFVTFSAQTHTFCDDVFDDMFFFVCMSMRSIDVYFLCILFRVACIFGFETKFREQKIGFDTD